MTHPTPRTDAAEFRALGTATKANSDMYDGPLVVHADFARQLERELAAERDAASGWMRRAGELESVNTELKIENEALRIAAEAAIALAKAGGK